MARAVVPATLAPDRGRFQQVRKRAGLLPRLAGGFWCALVLWLLVSNVVLPSYGFSRYETWAAALLGVLVLGMTLFFAWLLDRFDQWVRVRWVQGFGSVLGWGAVFAVLARLADAVRLPPDWDAAAVFYSAYGLADQGVPEAVDRAYFQVNPNNLLLMLLLSRYLGAAEALGSPDLRQSTAYLGAALLFAGMVLTYTATWLLGGRRAARLTLVPSVFLIVLSPWLTVFYSDVAALPFTILVFCLLLGAARCRLPARLLLWAAAGAVSAVGYGIKPTALIVLVAASVVILFSVRRAAWRRDLALALLSATTAAAAFAGVHAGIGAWVRSSGVPAEGVSADEYALPVTHFLKVGVQQYPGPHGNYYGAYNEEDRSTTLAVAEPQERFDAALQVYLDRVGERGPAGYAGFLNAKLRWMTGDGSFFAWGEGRMTADSFIADDPLSRSIQDFFGPERPGFELLLNLWQGTWFLLLVLCGAGLFLRGPPFDSRAVATARVALLGLFVFLLLSEGRARFLYLYVPFFIVLGSLSLQRLAAAGGCPRSRRLSWPRHRRDTPPPSSTAEVVE
ncbi:hypothetical protein GCM10009636_17560 [Arthrobacter koreensis]|uniref:hypothetical protein n=1 Tax=Arthrobacter koreensis TaxID=199136 RepID=UPI00186B51D7